MSGYDEAVRNLQRRSPIPVFVDPRQSELDRAYRKIAELQDRERELAEP